jgi:hypothetical protein
MRFTIVLLNILARKIRCVFILSHWQWSYILQVVIDFKIFYLSLILGSRMLSQLASIHKSTTSG